jgi:RNA polymerase sigma-70 factor (ECF subfamily)
MRWPGRLSGDAGDADELTLITRSQRGDVAAFNALVERHQEVAYSLALRMLGEPETAADVTQDAFVSAFRAIGSFRGAAFRSWLLRIVSNGCYDQFRARGRRPSTSLEALVEGDTAEESGGAALLGVLTDERWDPEQAALRAELLEVIQTALLELVPEQRLALILSDVQGMAYEEIAQVMQTSLGTVKSRLARARGHMRDLLRAHGELLPRAYRRAHEST